MKDFNDFVPEEKNTELPKDAFSLFSSLAAKYEGKSGDELLKAIIQEAEKSRKNGTLKDSDIDNFVSTLSPMLTGKQKKILDTVAAKIKKT